jgi:hypothetical protein
LQRVLDALEVSPALVKTATWDIVAWNRAAVVLTDYGALPPGQRNILRLMFGNPHVRAAQHDWDSVARFVVGAFRADAARAGAVSEVSQLVDELCRLSPEFEALWRENDVGVHGEGRQAAAASGARPDRAGIFGVCRRWSARSQHGRLQSGCEHFELVIDDVPARQSVLE